MYKVNLMEETRISAEMSESYNLGRNHPCFAWHVHIYVFWSSELDVTLIEATSLKEHEEHPRDFMFTTWKLKRKQRKHNTNTQCTFEPPLQTRFATNQVNLTARLG